MTTSQINTSIRKQKTLTVTDGRENGWQLHTAIRKRFILLFQRDLITSYNLTCYWSNNFILITQQRKYGLNLWQLWPLTVGQIFFCQLRVGQSFLLFTRCRSKLCRQTVQWPRRIRGWEIEPLLIKERKWNVGESVKCLQRLLIHF